MARAVRKARTWRPSPAPTKGVFGQHAARLSPPGAPAWLRQFRRVVHARSGEETRPRRTATSVWPGLSIDLRGSSWKSVDAGGSWERIVGGVKIPESTKSSLSQRLSARARERWPGLSEVKVRFRSGFAYIDGQIDEEVMPLCRLRDAGSASRWGFAVYRASHDDTKSRSCRPG